MCLAWRQRGASGREKVDSSQKRELIGDAEEVLRERKIPGEGCHCGLITRKVRQAEGVGAAQKEAWLGGWEGQGCGGEAQGARGTRGPVTAPASGVRSQKEAPSEPQQASCGGRGAARRGQPRGGAGP